MIYEGTMLNPDETMVRQIRKNIKKRNGFCLNKEEKNADTKCPCRQYREHGDCDCGLYVRDISALINSAFSDAGLGVV